MPEKDITERHLESYNDVFADIVNVLLFNGERRILPDDLRDTQARTQYKADGKLREQERDVSKLWAPEGIVISLIRSPRFQSAAAFSLAIRQFSAAFLD